VIKMKFAMQDCGPCPHRQACTQTQAASPRRTLTIPSTGSLSGTASCSPTRKGGWVQDTVQSASRY
jgi:hypothetical protein